MHLHFFIVFPNPFSYTCNNTLGKNCWSAVTVIPLFSFSEMWGIC